MGKVVFQTNDMKIAGGVERVISLWVNRFSKEKKEMEVYIATEDGQESFYDLEKDIKMLMYDYKSSKRFRPILRMIRTFSFLMQFEAGDTIIFNKYIPTTTILILKKLGFFSDLNLVYFAHGGTSQFWEFYKFYQRYKIFKAYDKIICLYDDLENDKKMSCINKKMCILKNPVSIKFDEIPQNREKYILTVARIVNGKGLELLLESWNFINKEVAGWKLKIIGSGPEEEKIKKIIEKYRLEDTVEMIEAQKDIEKFYANASILAMPSEFEGLPMVTIEALEAGLPIVSYDIDGNRDLISDNGILTECYNTKKFAENLKFLIDNKEVRIEMSKKSKEYSKDFRIESIEKAWNSIFKED